METRRKEKNKRETETKKRGMDIKNVRGGREEKERMNV